ncbi:chlorophyll a/b-binding protein [Oscillatoria sp. CS-180]|nr:chlorophyll a/b-binding protein [Oscillatoria sp. CS-180]MDB9526599.1 chlorophyll a/b-binding protein [Oscillatoria sp. CS-180]
MSDEADSASEQTGSGDGTPSLGWNAYAERINGRFAMVGFAALLILEWVTRQDFWTWIGL